MNMNWFNLLIVSLTLSSSSCFTEDEIQSLPGLAHNVSFRQYSGYLNGGQDIHIHYWFVESQSNPETDPVIIWLSDGHQMSAMYGLLTENGPFRVGSDGQTVTIDPNSWNTLVNVLYLESSFGVGFSYWTGSETFIGSDNRTVQINKNALDDFFIKFPHLANNALYVIGQMDAAPHVLNLALELMRNESAISLRGLAIGNGRLNKGLLESSRLHILLSHGLISAQTYEEFLRLFCQCTIYGYICNMGDSIETKSNIPRNMVEELNHIDLINDLNILSDCPPIYSSSETVNAVDHNAKVHDCPPDLTNLFMNKPEVRTALHISSTVDVWRPQAVHRYNESAPDVRSQMRELITVHNLTNIIVYNGDLDLRYNFFGNQLFVDSLGLRMTDGYKSWTVNGRIAGFVKRYEGLTLTSVRGAGHAVARDQPMVAMAIIKELIGISKLGS